MIKLLGKKRFLSLLLSMLILISLIPSTAFTAFAETTSGTLENIADDMEFTWKATNGDVVYEDGTANLTAITVNACDPSTQTYIHAENIGTTDKLLSFEYDSTQIYGDDDEPLAEDKKGYLDVWALKDGSREKADDLIGNGEYSIRIAPGGYVDIICHSGNGTYEAVIKNITVIDYTGPAIKLDPNGGELETKKIYANENGTLDSLPRPTREGYIFCGWYMPDMSGSGAEEPVFANYTYFSPDREGVELKAHWEEAQGKFVKGFYFEDNEGWTFKDADGDGKGFAIETKPRDDNDYVTKMMEGKGALGSFSGVRDENSGDPNPYNPDNWAISPKVELPAKTAVVSLFTASKDRDYPERFEVYAGTEADPEKMERVSGSSPLTTESADDGYAHITVDLSAFAGKKVYIGIRHCNSDGNISELLIDQVEVYGEDYPEVTFDPCGGYTEVTKESVNKKHTLDFLPRPTREGYIFAGWYEEAVDDEDPVESQQVFASSSHFQTSRTVYAHWLEAPAKLVKGFYFEGNLEESGWTFKDADGDGKNWTQEISTKYTQDENSRESRDIPEGKSSLSSYSVEQIDRGAYLENKELTPENWAISPEVNIPKNSATLSLWAKSMSFLSENFRIYAGESDDINEMTAVTGKLTAEPQVDYSGNYIHYTADLKDFAGKTIHIAICHKNEDDERDTSYINGACGLMIDLMEVYGGINTYDLWIDGIQVNEDNKDDILGNGIFSYNPEENILYVNGDYESEEENNVIRSFIEGLTVNVTKESTLKTGWPACVAFTESATITGNGKLTAISEGDCGILLYNSRKEGKPAKLMFDNVTVEARGKFDGISGMTLNKKNYNDSLEIINSDIVSISDIADEFDSAVSKFGDGITLTDCEIIEPADGKIGDNAILNGDDTYPNRVVIGKKNPDAAETTESTGSGTNTDPTDSTSDTGAGTNTDPTGSTSDTGSGTNTDPTDSTSDTGAGTNTEPTDSTSDTGAGTNTEPTDSTSDTGAGTNTEPTDSTSDTGAGTNTEPTGSTSDTGAGTNTDPTGSTSDTGSGANTEPTNATKATEAPAIKEITKGDSIAQVDAFIKKLKSEDDPKGSEFGLLCLKQKKVKKTSITVAWNKVKNAKKYVVYTAKCGVKKGQIPPFKKTKTVGKSTKSFTLKKLKKGTYYKFLVVAVDKNNKVITTSKTVHVVTKGGKNGNDKSVKLNKTSVKLTKKKTVKITAKEISASKSKKVKRHRKVRYESSNPKVAKVTQKGKITAKKKGTAYVFVYAQNGVYKKVKVKVK